MRNVRFITISQPDRLCAVLAVNLCEEEGRSLTSLLRGSNWTVKETQTCREALDLSREGSIPVVLCAPRMPDGNWNMLADGMHELETPPAVVVTSRLADDRLWVEVLNLGGYDVLLTPFDRNELFRVLFLAWMASRREAERTPSRLKKGPAAERTEADSRWRCAGNGR
jgi:DNA-binding NtrC family response regulator